jgi:hypothetical protein
LDGHGEMAKSTALNCTQNINAGSAIIQNLTGACGTALGAGTAPSNVLTCFTAGANDSVVDAILVSTDEATTVRVLSFWEYDGVSVYTFLFAVSIPLTSGVTGVAATANVDVLGSAAVVGLPVNASGRPYIPMKANHTIVVGSQVAVTSGKTLHINTKGQDY